MNNDFDYLMQKPQKKLNSEEWSKRFGSLAIFIAGISIGAVGAYYLDPVRGKRRRHVLRDQSFSKINEGLLLFQDWSRDLGHRLFGSYHEIRHPQNPDVDDKTLESRIRSAMGRNVRHSKAVKISAENGNVILSGPILSEEVSQLVRCVKRVPGVRSVENRLDVHQSGAGIPGLQGKGPEYLQ